ncbi:MAG TPA: sterol desaturase family protein [Ilumatobacter sp.]|nr:sterol desaturase family protein [Ilumatobacter sp.]
MTSLAVFLLTFSGMEMIAYSAHRWLMHGPGMVWHRSHHAPARTLIERNDLFPLCFSAVGVGLAVVAATGRAPASSWAAAAGVTAYGVAYLAVHEIVIHRRLSLPVPDLRYLRWLRDSHRAHHIDAGEPYGMLLPLMSAARRRRAAAARQASSADDDLLWRARMRPMRNRLKR